ncbi:Zinc finger protein isoform 1 [Schistosoma japonicum]|uniref:Zinc finger protein isoform 1 n=3 Tax=Schistosoma japonicum TaxID=6182 RepID=A0A4Z2CS44_SCHJA|nr:Zinc finger protein 235 [Schistosoma japonicum]TNN06830.1 Zinc finger protein isoform 1 [Schistosoma japonicum]
MFHSLVRMFCGQVETEELSNINVEDDSGIQTSSPSSSSTSCGCIVNNTSNLIHSNKISSRILEDAALKLWSNLNLDRINFNNELLKLTAKLHENMATVAGSLHQHHQRLPPYHHHHNHYSDEIKHVNNSDNGLMQILSMSNLKAHQSSSLLCSTATTSSIKHNTVQINLNNFPETTATITNTATNIPLSLTNYPTVSQLAHFASAANLFNSVGVDLCCSRNFYTVQQDEQTSFNYNTDSHANINKILTSGITNVTVTSNNLSSTSTTTPTNNTAVHLTDNCSHNQADTCNMRINNNTSHQVQNSPNLLEQQSQQSENKQLDFTDFQNEEANKPNELKHSKLSTVGLIKTKQTLYCCTICRQRFHSNTGLRRHNLALHATKAMKCDQCVKVFRHQAALSDHKKRVHGPREYICGICSADFATETYLRSHVRIHDEKRFICLECKHGFSNPSDLKNHMRIHNDEKPFECEVCGKAFRHVSGFYAHIRIHTGETPYQCELCAKKFSNASNFRMHRRVHTKEMQFRCQTCGKEFIQPSNYSRHLRIHTKERPYSCNLCSAEFLYSTSLKRHQQRHHGLELLRCQSCQKTFLNETCLIRHRTGCELRACVKTADEELYTHLL